jgi:RNA polymerase sigma-70 factor (sigma-E family)
VKNETDFVEFAEASVERLRSTAFMMCRDWHLAQDLTQSALTKLYVVWKRAAQSDSVEAYARKVLLRTYLDHLRRRSSSEWTVAVLPEPSGPGQDTHALRLTMLDALGMLPARDRAIVILRYWEDYSVERVADVLDIPDSVVKTQTKRSLLKLRDLLSDDQFALFA